MPTFERNRLADGADPSASRNADKWGFPGWDHLRRVLSDRQQGSRTRRLLRILTKGTVFRLLPFFRPGPWLRFRCNACGFTNVMATETVSSRDRPSCVSCASPLRLRTVIHALSTELFGKSLRLSDFPESPHLKGLGLSDWEGYAEGLSRRLNYTNTFYDEPPQLDIAGELEPDLIGNFDFVIASDVFEHVPPPVSEAFANLRRLLKDDGVLIFSVPYKKEGETREHYRDREEIEAALDQRRSRSGVSGGRSPRFHAGPGLTLEMRLFSEKSLIQELRRAGFRDLRFYRYDQPQWGIVSDEEISLVIAARP